jgi:uncharacterized protein YlxW (UPF0749 family)
MVSTGEFRRMQEQKAALDQKVAELEAKIKELEADRVVKSEEPTPEPEKVVGEADLYGPAEQD